MTIEREDIVTAVIASAGANLISRVRLQKSVYLLDQLGLGSKFDYEYYHYGPYSRDLDNATADAKAFGHLDEKFERRQSDGARYSVFTVIENFKEEALGGLGAKQTQHFMHLFVQTDVTVLELAATVDWLWRFEKSRDWKSEIRKRKGVKARQDRLEKALSLLEILGLKPPVPASP